MILKTKQWQAVLLGTSNHPEYTTQELLEAGTRHFLAEKAGFQSEKKPEISLPDLQENFSLCTKSQDQNLLFILQANDMNLLREWLMLAQSHQVRIRGERLPLFFEVCKKNKLSISLSMLYDAIGELGRWLLTQNKDWKYWETILLEVWQQQTRRTHFVFWDEEFSKRFLDWFSRELYKKKYFPQAKVILQALHQQIPPYFYEHILPKWDSISEDLYPYHHLIQHFLYWLKFRKSMQTNFNKNLTN